VKKIGILLAIAALVVGAVFVPRFLVIRTVGCSNQFGLCDAELKSNLEDVRGMSLLDGERKAREILSQDPQVVNSAVTYLVPGSLEIKTIVKKPEVATTLDGTEYFIYDTFNEFVERTPQTELPILIIEDNREEPFARELFRALFRYYGLREGRLTHQGLEVQLDGGVLVIFPKNGDIDILLGSLSIVLSRLNTLSENPTMNSTGRNFRELDLRFSRPVLR